VEEVGGARYDLAPGEEKEIALDAPLAPGEILPLLFEVTVPADAREGARYAFSLDPQLDDLALAGYAFELRIDRPFQFVTQTLDIACAAFQDYVDFTGSQVADELAAFHRRLLGDVIRSPGRLLNQLLSSESLFQSFAGEIAGAHPEDVWQTAEAFAQFLDALQERDNLQALLFYRDAASRLQMLCWGLYWADGR
jgi:hypothetical protein